jgi:hypothetical protein
LRIEVNRAGKETMYREGAPMIPATNADDTLAWETAAFQTALLAYVSTATGKLAFYNRAVIGVMNNRRQDKNGVEQGPKRIFEMRRTLLP